MVTPEMSRQLGAGGPGEAVALELAAAPGYRAEVASAALQVPVLVGG